MLYSYNRVPRYHGKTFTDVTVDIFDETQGQVLMIAIEHHQVVHCNPGHTERIQPSSKVAHLMSTKSF